MTPFETATLALTLLLVVIGIITVVLMAFQAGRDKWRRLQIRRKTETCFRACVTCISC